MTRWQLADGLPQRPSGQGLRYLGWRGDSLLTPYHRGRVVKVYGMLYDAVTACWRLTTEAEWSRFTVCWMSRWQLADGLPEAEWSRFTVSRMTRWQLADGLPQRPSGQGLRYVGCRGDSLLTAYQRPSGQGLRYLEWQGHRLDDGYSILGWFKFRVYGMLYDAVTACWRLTTEAEWSRFTVSWMTRDRLDDGLPEGPVVKPHHLDTGQWVDSLTSQTTWSHHLPLNPGNLQTQIVACFS